MKTRKLQILPEEGFLAMFLGWWGANAMMGQFIAFTVGAFIAEVDVFIFQHQPDIEAMSILLGMALIATFLLPARAIDAPTESKNLFILTFTMSTAFGISGVNILFANPTFSTATLLLIAFSSCWAFWGGGALSRMYVLNLTAQGTIPESIMDVVRILLTLSLPKRGLAIVQAMLLRRRDAASEELEAAKQDLIRRGAWCEEEFGKMWKWAQGDIVSFRLEKPENDGSLQGQGNLKMRGGHLLHKHQ